MPTHKRTLYFAAPVVLAACFIAGLVSTGHADGDAGDDGFPLGDDAFPRDTHDIFPNFDNDYVAYGIVDEDAVPRQPILYSHKLHAGELQIECEYCHNSARRSIHASVPPVQTCMNCHAMIDMAERPDLVKLKEYYDNGEPVPWVKVHDLPDFVHFSHKRHVLGGVECAECHGDMTQVTVGRRVNTLQMGWCLDCHREHPSVDENYGPQAELRRAELKDCYTCHK